MAPSATPKPAEGQKPSEPAKAGAAGSSAGSSSAAGTKSSETPKTAAEGGGKDAAAKSTGAAGGTASSASSSSSPNAASSSASSSSTVPKAAAADASKTSGPAPTEPAKAGATGSSAVPPASSSTSSGAPKPSEPLKGGATGTTTAGAGASKPGASAGASGAGASSKPQQGAARVGRDDALTDGPIIDLKANRSSDPAGAKPAAKDGGSTPPPAAAAGASKGPGFAALAFAGLAGGVIGALLLFLLAQTGVLASKGDRARLDELDKRIASLAPSSSVAALDKRVSANETALKPLPEAITKAQAAASGAVEKADQALQKASGSTAPVAEGAPVAPSDLVARLDALDQRVSALQEEPGRDQGSDAKAVAHGDDPVRLADIDERLKALETKGQAQGATVPEEDLAPKLATLQRDVEARTKANEAADKALGQRLDQLQQSLDSRIAAVTEAVQQASRQTAEAGKAQAEEAAKAIDRRLQEQGDRIAALDKTIDGSAKAATVQAALRAVAANRISDALATGAPYADALASLRGNDSGEGAQLQPLTAFADAGAPTASVLADEFRPIAEKIASSRRAARASARASSGSIGDRLLGMAESVVQVKRVGSTGNTASATPAADDEPEAKVQDALDHSRLDAAAKAFAAMPEDARAQAKEFGARLKSASDARAAAQALQADAFRELQAPAAGR
ncbi:hypothetical protein MMMDOFMJ_3713 [Methylobacterium gnaphalii]|nr:hypothetical protein MMMDOFMJ_3713 [Methylobacterium gnaphalii]